MLSVIYVVAVVTTVLQCHNHVVVSVVDAAKMITSLGGGGASSIGGGGSGQHPRKRMTASKTCSNTATTAGNKDEDDASCRPTVTAAAFDKDDGAVIRSYGVDCSFPIHHRQFQDNDGDDDGTACHQGLDITHCNKLYNEYISGCYQKYTQQVCNDSEESRLSMNIYQPSNVIINYTKVGYIKLRAPPELITQITNFWKQEHRYYYYSSNTMHTTTDDDNNDNNSNFINQLQNETHDISMENIAYNNHWISSTKMLHLSSAPKLRKLIYDTIQPIVESWSNIEVTPSSLVGIRIYTSGSVVAPHVDRAPLVLSAVINVAQSNNNDDVSWPLEVYGHDGKAMNITMNIGDMVLYEGHSVIHGRPFPLSGNGQSYYANVYVHFEPIYTFLQHEVQQQQQQQEIQDERDTNDDSTTSLETQYQLAWKKLSTNKCNLNNNDDVTTNENCRQGQQRHKRVPQYIHPGSIEEQRWVQSHSKSRLVIPPTTTTNTASTTSSSTDNGVFATTAHTAASNGDFATLITLAATNPKLIQIRDMNGWTALHEAVRGGHLDIVKYLISVHKIDYNERTNGGVGGSPLYWAKKTWGIDHPVTYYLISLGAVDIPPDGS